MNFLHRFYLFYNVIIQAVVNSSYLEKVEYFGFN